ncbi:MAG: phage terminase small subunit P27 family [Rikenellaceae bacterium]
MKLLKGTDQPCRLSGDTPSQGLIESFEDLKLPVGLRGYAKKVFIDRAKALIMQRILTENDLDMLVIYADAVATANDARKQLAKEGFIVWVKDEEGNLLEQRPNLWQKILNDSIKTINTYGSQFGFSPVSRIKLASLAVSVVNKNDFAEFEELSDE